MKKSIRPILLGGAFLFALSMSLTSCNGALEDILGAQDNPATETPTSVAVTSITLNKTYASLLIGGTETLTVDAVAPADATDKTVTWSSDNTDAATVDENTGAISGVAAGTATITATAKDGSGVKATCTVYVGLLSGKFTINADGDQIQFAQGNLQYLASPSTWRFAENQYDYIGNAPGNTTAAASRSTQSNWIDLFGWGTSGHSFASGYGTAYQPWSASTNPVDYGPTDGTSSLTGTYAQGDWGTNIGTGWRTLTKDEWEWLLGPTSAAANPGTDCRTSSTVNGTANARYALAHLFGIKRGIILFPDNYIHPADVNDQPVYINDNGSVGWGANTYNATDWAKMEAAGAVFLPAAAYREGTSFIISSTTAPFGRYWLSTVSDANNAYATDFKHSGVTASSQFNRHRGHSVRLVVKVPKP